MTTPVPTTTSAMPTATVSQKLNYIVRERGVGMYRTQYLYCVYDNSPNNFHFTQSY